MSPLTRLFPQSKPVQLGTRIFHIREMRVSDMVALQSWLDSQWECPLEALGASVSDVDGATRKKALLGAWDALEAGPPLFGSERGNELFDTWAGSIQILKVVLAGEELDGFEIAALREEITQEQYEEMLTVWRNPDPVKEVASILGFLPEDEGGKTVTWPEAILSLCEAYGWTLDYILTLTLSQIRMIGSGGKPVEYGTPVAPKTTLKETMMARRKQLEALERGEIV